MQKDAKIKGNVLWLGLVSLFTDASSEMILPILPLFLSTTLGVPNTIIGLIEGIAEATASILKTFSGWFSDKFNVRKPIVVSGYSIAALAKVFLPLATIWQHVLAVRFFDRVGKGLRDSPRDALIASQTKTARGKFFGFHRAMDSSGAIIGTVATTILLYLAFNYRTIFWIALIPAVLGVLVTMIFVKEKKIQKKTPELPKFSLKHLDPNYKRFLFVVVLFGLGNFSYALFLLRAKSLGVAVALIPIIYLLYNIFYAGFSLPVGKLSDRIGRKNILVTGYILFAIVTFGLAYTTKLYLVWILFAAYGLFQAITDGTSRAFVSDLVPEERRATAIGVYHTFAGLAALPASIIAGELWDHVSVQAAFLYGTVLAIIAAVFLIFIVKEKSR